MTDNPTAVVPSPPPVTPSPSQAPAPRFDRKDPYWDASHPEHKAAVEAVAAGFKARAPSAEPWRDDQLAHPGMADPAPAPYLLESPHPGTPWAPEDRRAVSNTFDAIAAGSKPLAQQGLDWLESSPAADRPPDLPATYTPPDEQTALAELRRGWGDTADENLRLARAVVAVYDRQKGGALGEYLARTGLGNDPRIIRLAARTGRAWVKAGWTP